MGKGDKRTRRGKIFAGSFGKTRQKPSKAVVAAAPRTKAAAVSGEDAPKIKVKKKTEQEQA
ncbi:MAG: 30S ribosomal protein THX [Acidobacteria bacterium]|nr:30S ribosomal protein THX [Acidobacteriota bacterium]